MSRFRFVEAEAAQFPVSLLCRVVGVTRQGFYAWRRRPPSARELADHKLGERICEIHAETEEIYGVPQRIPRDVPKRAPAARVLDQHKEAIRSPRKPAPSWHQAAERARDRAVGADTSAPSPATAGRRRQSGPRSNPAANSPAANVPAKTPAAKTPAAREAEREVRSARTARSGTKRPAAARPEPRARARGDRGATRARS